MVKSITLKGRAQLNKKKKSIYQKKPTGKLMVKPISEAERARTSLRNNDGIGFNDPRDRYFKRALNNLYVEAE